MAHSLTRYKASNEEYRINKIFSSTSGRVYNELTEKPRTAAVSDNGQLWKETWSNPKRHSEEGEWMAKLENSPEQCLKQIRMTEVNV